MSALLWTVAVIALINLALTVIILRSPGNPERNTIGHALRRGEDDAPWVAQFEALNGRISKSRKGSASR